MKNISQYKQEKYKRRTSSPIAQLMRIGRKKSFVTYEDILVAVPNPEQHLQYLELVFATLFAANVQIKEKN